MQGSAQEASRLTREEVRLVMVIWKWEAVLGIDEGTLETVKFKRAKNRTPCYEGHSNTSLE